MVYDVLIIGGGTAGLTAALYASRAGKRAVLLESENIGGQITFAPQVENYPGIMNISGSEFINNLYEQVIAAGADVEISKVQEIKDEKPYKKVITEDGEYTCKSIVIATGVKRRLLGIAGEEELTGAGVSYCALCDGAFFKGQTVAVAGGGNTAVEDAIYLSAFCKKVYIIHRRDTFRAEARLVELLKTKENVELVLDSGVSSLVGDGELTAIRVANFKTGEERTIDVEGLFVAIGHIPENDAFKSVVKLDEGGYIVSGEDCITSCEGIFAAGDCRTKQVRQLSTAAADGAVAAIAACSFSDGI